MKYILLLLLLIPIKNVYSQNAIDRLISFYNQADMGCYYSMIERNVNKYYQQEYQNWQRDKLGLPYDSIEICYKNNTHILVTKHTNDKNPFRIFIDSTHIVPMLAVQFVNTDKYNLNDNIYDYISIDSTIVFSLASVDKHNKVTSFLHFFDGYFGCHYVNPTNDYPKSVIKKIQKLKPELIMVTHFNQENKGYFLFIKKSTIYVYDIANKNCTELNRYIKERYSLERIRSFNNVYIPYIYTDKMETRITGNTPIEQINICK